MGDYGIGKTELAKVICRAFKTKVIPVGAIDMGGLRDTIAKPENQNKTHLVIVDLQAFNRSKESKKKLISYLTTMLSDSEFEDLSYDSKVQVRKNPLQTVIFANEKDLMYLFREQSSQFLDRVLVLFVHRKNKSEIKELIRRKIPYKLEIDSIQEIKGELSEEEIKAVIPEEYYPEDSVRKYDQLVRLHTGLYEIGFNGKIPIFNAYPATDDYEHYYDRFWKTHPIIIDVDQKKLEKVSLKGSSKNKNATATQRQENQDIDEIIEPDYGGIEQEESANYVWRDLSTKEVRKMGLLP